MSTLEEAQQYFNEAVQFYREGKSSIDSVPFLLLCAIYYLLRNIDHHVRGIWEKM